VKTPATWASSCEPQNCFGYLGCLRNGMKRKLLVLSLAVGCGWAASAAQRPQVGGGAAQQPVISRGTLGVTNRPATNGTGANRFGTNMPGGTNRFDTNAFGATNGFGSDTNAFGTNGSGFTNGFNTNAPGPGLTPARPVPPDLTPPPNPVPPVQTPANPVPPTQPTPNPVPPSQPVPNPVPPSQPVPNPVPPSQPAPRVR